MSGRGFPAFAGKGRERSWRDLPTWLWLLLILALALQLASIHYLDQGAETDYQPLPPAPDLETLRALAPGSTRLLASLLLIRLQLQDEHKGEYLNYRHLDWAFWRRESMPRSMIPNACGA